MQFEETIGKYMKISKKVIVTYPPTVQKIENNIPVTETIYMLTSLKTKAIAHITKNCSA